MRAAHALDRGGQDIRATIAYVRSVLDGTARHSMSSRRKSACMSCKDYGQRMREQQLRLFHIDSYVGYKA